MREGLFAIPEQRIRVGSTRFRVPDVCVYESEPDEQVFTSPPLAIFEVLSPEDRLSRIVERIDDYVAMRVKHIFLIDPGQKKAFFCDSEGFHAIGAIEIGAHSLPLIELF